MVRSFSYGAALRLGSMVVAAAALAMLAGGACRGKGAEARAPGGGGGGRIGTGVGDFRVVALDGQELTGSALHGKVVLVDFWDTWCGPCLRAMPHLKELGQAHEGQVVIIAVAIGQEGEAKVREVMARYDLRFPVALLAAQGDLTTAFGEIAALPTTFLVDQEGVIRQRWVGAQSPATYEKSVRELLGA
ncbi:MAG: TlpA family protein disulfide reductase [bacterium]|nr:TlpA family protein disulfide reductase [bacterium]